MKLFTDMLKAVGQISNANDMHSFAASAVRFPRGLIVVGANRREPPRPEKALEIYEFEGCPFCRKVREAMTELDLSFVNRTCAKGDRKKRAQVKKLGGKEQFPFLVDPNTGEKMYESEAIIDYLWATYGPGRSGLRKVASPVTTTLATAASAMRLRGGKVKSGYEDREQPEELLVLYNMETSPYCRKVREVFNELNLDYQVENVGKGSARRAELVERGGKVMVPYLIDPNREQEMYESEQIVAYLKKTYG